MLLFWLGSYRATFGDLLGPLWGTPGSPETNFSSTGRGEKSITSAHQVHETGLFLDRQGQTGENPITSASQIHGTACSSTGRGERPAQAHSKRLFLDRQDGKCVSGAGRLMPHSLPEDSAHREIVFSASGRWKSAFGSAHPLSCAACKRSKSPSGAYPGIILNP